MDYLQGLAEADPENPPEAILNRPELSDYLADILAAFWVLSPGRSMGFGAMGGISFADIAAYCRLFEVENPRTFVRWIRELDAEFLALSQGADKGEG